ncbi:hypothetical protein BSL78_23656 [Apostichopus japonicus]|uniref:Reverse transcriptase domain-containing protein n=1 Tax=Stichopus japonicus TaxID=307972 RepID=A0A2G8JUS5_STIJA|nr:hypothetical protein BSL78_23656 [Apostichopus japonicus]
MKSAPKSCQLDPVPTSVIKQCIDVFVPYITNIVNTSLSSSCFPESQKIAYVRPLLKKAGLDREILKNYRPVSNLKFLGKTIERVVSSRINDHISDNLSDVFQSAYKQNHGTETALIRVNNDILTALDNGMITALVLLDLSAAFDTVDHDVLIFRLRNHLGLRDTALNWCKSYLSQRPQHICIGNAISDAVVLDYSSIISSIMFMLMTLRSTSHSNPVNTMLTHHSELWKIVYKKFGVGCSKTSLN